MSEDQTTRAEEVIERISKKEKLLNKLLYTLIGSIVVMVGSVTALTNSSIQNKKDIEYVRSSSVNKKAFYNLMDTYKANIEGITSLINDEEVQDVVHEFNKKTDAIIDRIMMAETEIVPRSVEVNNVKKFAK